MHDDAAFDGAYSVAFHRVSLSPRPPSPRARRAAVALLAVVALLLGVFASAGTASASTSTVAAAAKPAKPAKHATDKGAEKGAAKGAHAHQKGGSVAGPTTRRAVSNATLSGQVTFPPDCTVFFCYFSDRTVVVRHGHYARQGFVNFDGSYTVYGLRADTYRVTFSRLSGYAETAAQFYNGHDESAGIDSANLVTVAQGEDKTGINATLKVGGTITGTITDADGDELASCHLQAYTADGRLVTRTAWSDFDGSFTITGLTTGDYFVRVVGDRSGGCDGGTQYVIHANGGVMGPTAAQASPVHVVQGSATHLSADLVYATAGRITGHVDAPPGTLGKDRVVVARDGHYTRVGRVDQFGDYTIRGLNTGTYRVTFARVSGMATLGAVFYDGHPESAGVGSVGPSDKVHVTRGETSLGVDATLTTGGTISGDLVDATSLPAENCYVQAFTADGHLVTRADYTDETGHFSIGGLATGSYLLRVVKSHARGTACKGLAQFYVSTAPGFLGGRGAATPVSVTYGSNTAVGGPLVYSEGATVSGHVTLPPGSNYRTDGRVVLRHGHRTWHTRINFDGDYNLRHLPAGTYRLTFNRISGFANAAPQFYRGHSESFPIANVEHISLTKGQQVVADPATLAPGGHITGALVDQHGTPLRCLVQAFTADGSRVTRDGMSKVSSGGVFDIGGLATGMYNLKVTHGHQCKLPAQYLATVGTVSTNGTLTATAPGITVTTGQGSTVQVHTLTYPSGTATPVILNQTAPTITGTPEVGQTLTAHPGTWNPSDVTFTYQWLAGNNDIAGAHDSTFVVTNSQVNKTVSVRVTAHKPGFLDGTKTSAPVGPVPPPTTPPLVNSVPPAVIGTPQAGQPVAANPGTWTPAGATFSYQWLAAGSSIAGATASTYVLTANEVGKTIAVRVTASKPGFTSAAATSTAVGPVTAASAPPPPGLLDLVLAHKASFKGTAKAGQVLKAVAGTTTPGATTVTYQWLLNGKAIKKATKSKYKLKARDAGKKISVRITYARSGYTTLVSVSKAKKVKAAPKK